MWDAPPALPPGTCTYLSVFLVSAEACRHRLRRLCLQDKINQVNKLAHAVKTKVESLDEDNAGAKKKRGQGDGTAAERTRTTITAGLKKKLKDAMGEFSDLRSKIQEEYREVVERRVYTVTGAARAYHAAVNARMPAPSVRVAVSRLQAMHAWVRRDMPCGE